MLRMYEIICLTIGEKLPHEQGEIAMGKYSCPMEHLGAWMSQEVSKRLGSVGDNPNLPHL